MLLSSILSDPLSLVRRERDEIYASSPPGGVTPCERYIFFRRYSTVRRKARTQAAVGPVHNKYCRENRKKYKLRTVQFVSMRDIDNSVTTN